METLNNYRNFVFIILVVFIDLSLDDYEADNLKKLNSLNIQF